jgi:ABC-type multidrug transport system fused ATPase/permease subunit
VSKKNAVSKAEGKKAKGKKAKGPRFGDARRVFRLLVRFARGQRKAFALAFVLLLLEAITAVFEPWPLAYLIDFLKGDKPILLANTALFVPSKTTTIAILTAGIVALAAINSYCDSMAEVYLARGGRKVGYNLRVALVTHLEKLSLSFHNQRRTGDVLTRVTSDVTELEEFITDSVSDLTGSIFVLTGTLAFLAWKSPQVMVLAIVIVPVLALVSSGFTGRIKAAAKQQRAREGDLASHAQEMLTLIGVIQTFGRGSYERQRFAHLSDRAMQSALRAARLEAAFGWVVSVAQALCIVGVVWTGIWLVDRNAATVGDVILYILLITNMFKPTKRIIKEWNTIGKVFASVERVEELLDREPTVRDEPDAVEAPPLRGHIEFRDVSFAYQLEPGPDGQGPSLALEDLSFTVQPGQTVALVGHSGAGKSTIAQLLPRLYDPHAGQVLLDGYDARDFTLASLRAQVTMVLQETVLFTGTVAENIAYGRPDATHEEIVEAARRANAEEFIQRLPDGYETELTERGANLSGGQRQRLSIARSFIRETPILILDEPTTGMDAESTQLVLDALHKLVEGKTAIIISHDLNLIRSADSILVMSAGQVVQQGTHAELIEREGLYASLHAKQFGVAVGEAGAEAFAVPSSPEPEPLLVADFDSDDTPVPVQRHAFETALMEVLPLPATPEAFRLLTGKLSPSQPKRPARPPVPDRGGDGRDGHDGRDRHDGGPAEPPPVEVEAVAADDDGGRATVAAAPEPAAARQPDKPAKEAPAQEAPAQEAPAQEAPAQEAPAQPLAALDAAAIPAVRRELPGLAEALDAAAMQPRLGELLNDSWLVQGCSVAERMYLPGAGCTVRYTVELGWEGSDERGEHLVSGRVLPAELNATEWLRERLLPLAVDAFDRDDLAPFARPVAAVERLNMVLYAFPVDLELPGLLAATDPTGAVELVRAAVPDATASRAELVAYGRHGRCVLRYEVDTADGTRTLYGKVYAGELGEAARKAAGAIGGVLSASFGVERTLAYHPGPRLALLAPVAGRPRVLELLQAEPGTGEALDDDLAACARLAAAIHAAPVTVFPERTVATELHTLRGELLGTGGRAPVLGVRLSRWLASVEAAAAGSAPLPLAPAHGSLTPARVLFDGDRCGLIGLDTVCLAEPALDLGRFLAHLRMAVAEAGQAGHDADRLAAHVLEAYAQAAGVDQEQLSRRVAVFEALSLTRIALRRWAALEPAALTKVLQLMNDRRSLVAETAR